MNNRVEEIIKLLDQCLETISKVDEAIMKFKTDNGSTEGLEHIYRVCYGISLTTKGMCEFIDREK